MPISQITGASIQDGSIVVADLGITTFNTGTGNTLTLQANSATGLVISVTGNTAIANSLSFSSTGARITGDFSNATIANQLMFQSSTANGTTTVYNIPNGTATTTSVAATNSSDVSATSTGAVAFIQANATDGRLGVGRLTSSGSFLPLTMFVGGGEKLRIDTSGNVGIGTASPSSSSGYTSLTVNNATNGGFLDLQKGGTTYLRAEIDGSNNATLGSATAALRFQTNNVERMRVALTGNIGIGTTSPSQLLHVAAGTILASNTSSTTATVSIAGNGSTTGTSDFSLQQGTSSEAYVFNRANSFLVLGTNNTERMRITAGGYVGIGTSPLTNPAYLQQNYSTTENDVALALSTISNSSTAGSLGLATRLRIGSSNSANNNGVAEIRGLHNLYQNALSALTFWTHNGTSLAERVRIDEGGNVLVGTTTVSYSGANRGNITVGGTSSAIYALQVNGTNSGYIYHDGTAAGMSIWNAVNSSMYFATNNTERMRITSTGQVGINGAPNNTLQVSEPSALDANFYLTATAANRAAIITLNSTIAGYDWLYSTTNGVQNWRIGGGATSATLTFGTGSSGTERMRITSGGNVLVNTTVAPVSSAKFAINSGINTSSANVLELQQATDGNNKAAAAFGLSIQNGGQNTNAADLTIATASGGSLGERGRFTSGGLFQFNSGYGSVATAYGCRAWVNYNAVSGSIRGSGNVSSVTNNGTGDNTINFSTAMPDTNYSWAVTQQLNGTGNNDTGASSSARNQGTSSWSTSAIRILTMSNTNASQENPLVLCVQIFR
jgi:hypothetical protein